MSHGGIVVALVGAHPAAAKPVVETLLEGHRPDDSDAPCVQVCFSPRELLDVQGGARVVLLGAEEDAAWLNMHRPVVQERSLAVFLWVTSTQLRTLQKAAPDFVDWISHRIEIPRFGRVMRVLGQVMATNRWVAIIGGDSSNWFDEESVVTIRNLDSAGYFHGSLVRSMATTTIIVHSIARSRSIEHLMLAHAQARWRHNVVLIDPAFLPPTVPTIDGRSLVWRDASNALAVRQSTSPRIEAALADLDHPPAGEPRVAQPQIAELTPSTFDLISRVADSNLGPDTIIWAWKLRFVRAASSFLRDWLKQNITRHEIFDMSLISQETILGQMLDMLVPIVFLEMGGELWDQSLPNVHTNCFQEALLFIFESGETPQNPHYSKRYWDGVVDVTRWLEHDIKVTNSTL